MEKSFDELIDTGQFVIRGTVLHEHIRYYVIDDLEKQQTLHIPIEQVNLYFLTADKVNGIQEHTDRRSDYFGEPLSQIDFCKKLMHLREHEVICSYVTFRTLQDIAFKHSIT